MTETAALFPPAAPADLQHHAIFLTRCADAREKGEDGAARIALGTYLTLRVIDRAAGILADPEPEEVEGFGWQLRSAINFVKALPVVGSVSGSHLHAIVEAIGPASRGDSGRLRVELLAFSWHLEGCGKVEEALDVLGASALFTGSVDPQTQVQLRMTAGRLHRTLTNWDSADDGYREALEAATALGDVKGALLARLGRAKVIFGRGNLPEARRQMEEIIEEAEGKALAEVRGWAYSDLANVLESMGDLRGALSAHYRAYCVFSQSADRCRVLGNIGSGFRSLGLIGPAKQAFEQVLRDTLEWQLRMNALIELCGVHAELGDEFGFRRYWNEVEPDSERLPPSTRVDYQATVGLGLARFGRKESGVRWLSMARDTAHRYDLNTWYFKVDRILGSLAMDPEALALPDPVALDSGAVAEVIEGLERSYATNADAGSLASRG